MRSGYVTNRDGIARYVGLAGYWWSNVALANDNSSNGARNLLVDATIVADSDYSYRSNGYSLRCLAG